jgi:hypothetical protein
MRRVRQRRSFGAIALAAVVVLLAGWVPAAAAPAAAPVTVVRPRHRVDLYGDSVIGGQKWEIADVLRSRGYAPRINAIPGVSIEQVAAAVMSAPSLTDVVVLGLGYTYFWKPVVLRRDVDAVMYALTTRGVRHVIWMNLRENRPERRDVNLELTAATHRWGNLEVVDWNSVSRGVPGVFRSDGHHLLPTGGRLMARLMARQLDAYVGRRAPAALPRYGPRMPMEAMVQAFGRPDTTGAGAAASHSVTRSPLVGVAATVSGNGYWLARRDGSVGAYGDARSHGSASSLPLNQPMVGIVATKSGKGYWLVAADGGVFSFGDAGFYGSTGAIALRSPIVGMARTPSGRGYWLVAGDGGVFSYGDARFYGSTGAISLNEPIVGMAPLPNGRGYWLAAYDGGVFTFGDARYFGSGATTPRYWKIVAIAPAADGRGYWELTANGEVLAYGTAQLAGAQTTLRWLYFGIAPRAGGGYWLAAQGKQTS